MAQAVDGSRGEQPVAGEGLIPLGEVEVAGDDGGGTLVALGDEVVQVLVGGGAKGFEAEVVDDEQRHAGQLLQLSLIGADRLRGVQAGEQLRAGGEDDVVPLTPRTTRQSRCPRAPPAPALRVLAAPRALHAARAAPRHETGPRTERSPSAANCAAHPVMDRLMLASALGKRGTTAGL